MEITVKGSDARFKAETPAEVYGIVHTLTGLGYAADDIAFAEDEAEVPASAATEEPLARYEVTFARNVREYARCTVEMTGEQARDLASTTDDAAGMRLLGELSEQQGQYAETIETDGLDDGEDPTILSVVPA